MLLAGRSFADSARAGTSSGRMAGVPPRRNLLRPEVHVHRFRFLLAIVVLTTLFAVSAAATPSPVNAAVSDQARVAELINVQRTQRGLPVLTVNAALTTAAQRYADYMATRNFFSHTGLDGSTMVSRAQAAGYTNWSYVAENIAAGYGTPDQVVNGWMNSSGHRANILSPNLKEIGVGKGYNAASTYKTYWVTDFGTRR
jgi:uncharacterized protein YkwD